MKFTVEETNLMCIYTADIRKELMDNLTEMQRHLQEDETEMRDLTREVIFDLQGVRDSKVEKVAGKLVADFK